MDLIDEYDVTPFLNDDEDIDEILHLTTAPATTPVTKPGHTLTPAPAVAPVEMIRYPTSHLHASNQTSPLTSATPSPNAPATGTFTR